MFLTYLFDIAYDYRLRTLLCKIWLKIIVFENKWVYLQSHYPMKVPNEGFWQSGEHYIMEKRHMMLCRLAVWNYHRKRVPKTLLSLMPRVCWICIPVVCLKANHAFTAHFRVNQQYVTWVSLCSSALRAVVGLRQRMSMMWIPTSFRCVVKKSEYSCQIRVSKAYRT